MKVHIGPYVSWFGPDQLAEKLLFWLDSDSLAVEKLGDFLAWGFSKDQKNKTWVYKLLEWIYAKRERRCDVTIQEYDTWNMDHTLALIILPMLIQLRNTKQGSPPVYDDDLPDDIVHKDIHERWSWILAEMIFAFECKSNPDWEDHCVNVIRIRERMENGLRLFGKYYGNLWD